ncbi:MAG: histidinol-phosphate transaminase [Candidatus Bathyarchaeia archaeon]
MNMESEKWLEKKIEKLQRLESYTPEKTNAEIAKEYRLKVSDIQKLNYNENLYIPRTLITQLLKEVAEECDPRIYPQEEEVRLKEKIGEYLNVPAACVTIGNSSDEVMEHVLRIFLEKDDKAVTFTPTFTVFKYCVQYQDANCVAVQLRDDFSIDIEAIQREFNSKARLLYLCSPNNPTGNQFRLEEMKLLIEDFPGIVLVDEAYAEYADYSLVPLINEFKNLIVLRTFSKAFGLAGLRLGYAVANSVLADVIDRKPAPYAVNVVSLRMGTKMLENLRAVQEAVAALKVERGKLISRLNQIKGIKAFDSKANFVLFNTEKPYTQVYECALRAGLIIKKLGKLLKYDNCLRSTVGLPETNIKLLNVLNECLGGRL